MAGGEGIFCFRFLNSVNLFNSSLRFHLPITQVNEVK